MTDRSILIHARAGTVYPLIADPIRMAEWSPECVRCRWVGGARRAEVGARFRGTSRNGRRRWSTTSTIAEMRDGELFAWKVTYFRLPVARWEYRLEPEGDDVRADRSGGRPAWPLAPDVVASHHRFTGSAPPQRRHDGDHPGRHQGSRRGTRSLTPAGRNRPAQGSCQRRAVHCEA